MIKEDFNEDDIWKIDNEDYEGSHIVDRSQYVDGWYRYIKVWFAYEGEEYSYEYRKHTSPNISDVEILQDIRHEGKANSIDENEEAEFIKDYYAKKTGEIIQIDAIKLIIEGQMEYMKSIGLVN